ncbi:MAG: hypothetical protein K8T25_15120 [Planctomycetia bacterium]|nr:hypothetical protein [Planctomycetia bacterium]
MICQTCGADAPTKYVEFYQNIGVLVMRFHQSIKGNMCKPCIHKHFWQYTLVNTTLGWWGMISIIVTPFFIINNTVRYILCLGMDPPSGSGPPQLTDDIVNRLQPHAQQLFARLNNGEKLDVVAGDIARMSGATPGQVLLFLRATLQAHSSK